MSGIAVDPKSQGFVDWIVRAVAEVFSQALSSKWTVETSPDEAARATEDHPLCISLTASGSIHGTAALEIKDADASLLAHKFLAEPVSDTSKLDEGQKEAVEELMRQVAGVAATGMKSLLGNVELQVSVINVAPPPGATVVLLVSDGSDTRMSIALRLSAELLASMSSQESVKDDAAEGKRENENRGDQANTERVLGVCLKLSLRFGQRSLTLREILELRSGTIVELDQHVEDPVELVIGKNVIARGHVVVVDGNYGLRITESHCA